MELTGTVYLKQGPGKASKHFGYWDGPSAPELHTHTNSFHKYYVRKQSNGNTWVTGLDPNAPDILLMEDKHKQSAERKRRDTLRKELEGILGVSLDAAPNLSNPEQDFWLNEQWELIPRGGEERALDLKNPKDKLFYIVGLANKWFAPDYDALEDHEFRNTYLYVYNPQAQVTRKQQVQELRDEIAALMVLAKRDKDKLFYWASAVKLSVNWGMDHSVIYNLLVAHRESKKTPEELQNLLDTLKKPLEELTISYLVDWGIRTKKIRKVGLSYSVMDAPDIGDSVEEVKTNLALIENVAILQQLIQAELNSRQRK